MVHMTMAPFALWLTGLPASGKSSIVARLLPKLASLDMTVEVLESDAVRRILTHSVVMIGRGDQGGRITHTGLQVMIR